ncbi:MAG: signal peptidase I [Lachnospiraceae bacterium]|nr:signal peptidase I [Lachnospiraceae bacterium]
MRRKGLSFRQKKKLISASLMREIWSYVFITLAAAVLAFVIIFCVGMRTSVIGVSMEPVLYNGQEILVNRFIYRIIAPKAGDVVVFLPNGNENTHYYVKRVVATSGDTVQIKNGLLYVNGILYKDVEYDKIEDAGIAENPVTLGNNEFFALGDNINNSEDSRSGNIGAVSRDNIIGKVWFHMAAGDSSIGLME